MRVTGHGLLREGRGWDHDERRFVRVAPAVCSCGWMSHECTSDNSRKRAHRAHKLRVLQGGAS